MYFGFAFIASCQSAAFTVCTEKRVRGNQDKIQKEFDMEKCFNNLFRNKNPKDKPYEITEFKSHSFGNPETY